MAFPKSHTGDIVEALGTRHLCSYLGLHTQPHQKQPLGEFPVIPTQTGTQAPLLQLIASEQLPQQKQVFHRQLYKQVPTDELTAKKTDSRGYQPREVAHK